MQTDHTTENVDQGSMSLGTRRRGDDDDDILSNPVVFFDTAGCEYYERTEGDSDEGSKCNENEVTIVKNWVDQLVRDFAVFPLRGL